MTSDLTSHERDELLTAELNAALADNLVQARGVSDEGQLFLAAVTVGIFWPYIPAWAALSWLGIFIAIFTVKIVGRRRWLPTNRHLAPTWVRIEAWITAALWSAWASLLVGAPDIVVALLLLIYAGLISVAASTLVADRSAFQGFTAILLAPVTVILMVTGLTWVNASAVVLIALYAPLMIYVHETAERGLRHQLLSNVKLRRSEREAAQRTAFLGALVERAPNPIVVLGSDHRIVSVNPAFESVTGRAAAAITGERVESLLVGSEDRAEWAHLLHEMDEQGRASAELRLANASGEPIVVRFSAARGNVPTKDTVILMGEDVTEQVRAREASEAARIAAEAATLAKSSFLASMSHEVRTPLHGIIGMMGLLVETPLTDEQRRTAQIVRDSADQLLVIVNDILDVSKIEAGQLTLSESPLDVHEVVRVSATVFESQAADAGLRLVTYVGLDVPRHVWGDRVRIGQILTNLLSNAVKFTDEGVVSLTVELESRSGDRAGIRFAVKDTGIGISADQVGRVFQEFVQAPARGGRVTRGTGLGLSIAARLARMMKSEIRVESTEGVGSTFSFVLDLPVVEAGQAPIGSREPSLPPPGVRPAPADAPPAGAPVASGSVSRAVGEAASPTRLAASAGPAASTPAKILLAEDNPVNQQVALAVLRRRGYEVDLVEDGRAAVEAVGAGGYDLVLMDIQMPELSGVDATREIRRTLGPEELPIVALTAHALDEERRRCLEAGMNDFLSKPFKPADLHASVERWLANRGARSTG